MVDPVIDEHFRRSLGADYMNLFGKRLNQLKSMSSASTIVRRNLPISQSVQSNTPEKLSERSLQTHRLDEYSSSIDKHDSGYPNIVEENVDTVDMSVDDHFAKALGDTWIQLQQNKSVASPTEPDHGFDDSSTSINDSIAKDDDPSSPKVDPKHKIHSDSRIPR